MVISKSRYTNGVQCPKMLWMQRNMPQEFDDSVLNEGVLEAGSEVGDLAMGYFGPYVEVAYGDRQAMADETARLLAAGAPVICEASFAHDGCFCSVDILRVEADGVRLVEVKSSTHVKEVHRHDLAFQAWLLGECGLTVKSAGLLHLDSDYVREGELDLHRLFALADCTETVRALVPGVAGEVARLKAVAAQPTEPNVAIGCQCKSPYACGYRGWCWRDVPKPSVFDLARMNTQKALDLAEQGIVTLADVDAAPGVSLSRRQQVQVTCEVEDLPQVVDRGEVARFVAGGVYPLGFLDFETAQPAVPLYDGTHPYQQIPTQYSLHVLREPGGELEHYEYLAPHEGDPRRGVAEHLVADVPASGTVYAYNVSFENGRMREMAQAFPDLAERLLGIVARTDDLIRPFQGGAYYARAMGGSNSIKYVLPALFPGDPELDYHNLQGVHNGSEAMTAFARLASMTPEDRARTREQLLRYCELDTYAMVKIWRKLVEAAG